MINHYMIIEDEDEEVPECSVYVTLMSTFASISLAFGQGCVCGRRVRKDEMCGGVRWRG